MKLGRYAGANGIYNYDNEDFVSGAVVISDEFDILDHPTSRLVVVRPVVKLDDALKYIHQSVSTVGVYPEERRGGAKGQDTGRGVSSVFPLGQCEKVFCRHPPRRDDDT
jgi:hypothetical protein